MRDQTEVIFKLNERNKPVMIFPYILTGFDGRIQSVECSCFRDITLECLKKLKTPSDEQVNSFSYEKEYITKHIARKFKIIKRVNNKKYKQLLDGQKDYIENSCIKQLLSIVDKKVENYRSDLFTDYELIRKNPNLSFLHLARKNGTHILFFRSYEMYCNMTPQEIRRSIEGDTSMIQYLGDHDRYENYTVLHFNHRENKLEEIKIHSMRDLYKQHIRDIECELKENYKISKQAKLIY